MSYSGRIRYKSRREKNKLVARKLKVVVIFALIALVILAIKNRVAITDYIRTYFY